MTYLLDTCVLSEGIKAEAHAPVIDWLKAIPASQQFASVVSLGRD